MPPIFSELSLLLLSCWALLARGDPGRPASFKVPLTGAQGVPAGRHERLGNS